MPQSWRNALILALILAISACATTKPVEPFARPAPEHALPPKPDGAFSGMETEIRSVHGVDVSGFHLIDRNENGLRWRLALIDSARYSIDLQYYLWYGDAAGRILSKHLIDAADRGVKVRMLVDDISTSLKDSGTVALRDKMAAMIDSHPNIEVRLFNPWTNREILGRLGELLVNLDQINQRMHNKSMTVDNHATILGGRNVGDEYMGLNTKFNFRDLDVLAIGPAARQVSDVFDKFWNSEWVMPVSALDIRVSKKEQDEAYAELVQWLQEQRSLARLPASSQSWSSAISGLRGTLQFGTSEVYSDLPSQGHIEQLMLDRVRSLLASAQSELLIINAYIIPTDYGVNLLERLHSQGVEIKILTNSLASTDVPAVISHYMQWRKPIVGSGAKLFELRHDPEIKPVVCDTPPTRSDFVGLHAKALVIDRKQVFVGSMNLDPRSALINTEMGVLIQSRGLGEQLSKLIERDIRPANSWQVESDGHGGLRWVDDTEVVTSQPARYWWQRVETLFFMGSPKEYY